MKIWDRIKVPILRRFVLDHGCRDSRGCRNSQGGDLPRQSRQPHESRLPRYFRAFKQIFEHINCPLSGLILEPRKPMSED